RNRLKVESAVKNARAFLSVQNEFGSFAAYQWRFVEGRPQQHRPRAIKDIPARTDASDAFSKDLKRRGFGFVGSTIIYAHMQAVAYTAKALALVAIFVAVTAPRAESCRTTDGSRQAA